MVDWQFSWKFLILNNPLDLQWSTTNMFLKFLHFILCIPFKKVVLFWYFLTEVVWLTQVGPQLMASLWISYATLLCTLVMRLLECLCTGTWRHNCDAANTVRLWDIFMRGLERPLFFSIHNRKQEHSLAKPDRFLTKNKWVK